MGCVYRRSQIPNTAQDKVGQVDPGKVPVNKAFCLWLGWPGGNSALSYMAQPDSVLAASIVVVVGSKLG